MTAIEETGQKIAGGQPFRAGVPGSGRVPFFPLLFQFLGTRLLILLVAGLSQNVVKPGDDRAIESGFLNWFNCWDAEWYLKIAGNGYTYRPDAASSVAFFPLYPMLVRIVRLVIPDPRIAGYLVSNTLLFAGCVLLWKLVRRESGSEKVADRASLFFLLTPVTLFFSTIYSESLFFFLMAGTLYFAVGRRWLAAALCGYLGGLTRHVGVLLAVPLAVECWNNARQRMDGPGKWNGLRFRPDALLACAAPVCGLATYCAFLWAKFGDPLVFEKTQKFWGRKPGFFWNAFYDAFDDWFYGPWFCGAIAVAVVLIVLGWFLRVRPSFQAVSPVYLLLFLSTGQIEASPRFLSVLFPLYLILALAVTRWPRMEPVVLTVSASLLTISTILFVNGYWFV